MVAKTGRRRLVSELLPLRLRRARFEILAFEPWSFLWFFGQGWFPSFGLRAFGAQALKSALLGLGRF